MESDASGAPLVGYTLANRQLISQVRDGAPSYYLTDGQGSVRALTDASGAITDTYAYTAFGELYAQTGGTENSYLYTGQQFDGLTGLYSLRARYYDPGLGRFLSQDTAGVLYGNPVELNRYVYVADDPINRIDPSGMLFAEYSLNTVKSVAPTFVIGGAVGGAFISGIVCILAACGFCGDTVEAQMAPGGIGSCAAAALKGARFGVFAGGTIAVAAGFGPAAAGYATAFWGGVGLGVSGYNMITNRKFDLCNLFMMAVSLIVGTVGAQSAAQYVQEVITTNPVAAEEGSIVGREDGEKPSGSRTGSTTSGSGASQSGLAEIFRNPSSLAGKTPSDVEGYFPTGRWLIEDARGTSGGTKFSLLTPRGQRSGLVIRWSTGSSGRHFSGPYWRFSIPNGSPSALWVGPDGVMYTIPPGVTSGTVVQGVQWTGSLNIPEPYYSWIFGE